MKAFCRKRMGLTGHTPGIRYGRSGSREGKNPDMKQEKKPKNG
jgi:hypothetical protein